jgi:ATP-dependent Clp endopeptidase proteolytic subunit ClpP
MNQMKTPDNNTSTADDLIDITLLNSNVHYLTGEIDEDNIGKAIKWILYSNAKPGKVAYLTLYVNSIGGDLCQAFALIDMMKTTRIPVRTVGLGSICSAGFLIFSSGEPGYRTVFRNTEIMCHQYSSTIEGKHHDLKSNVKSMDMSNDKMVRLLCENTGMDAKSVKKKLLPESDVWLTPEELVSLGVADNIR